MNLPVAFLSLSHTATCEADTSIRCQVRLSEAQVIHRHIGSRPCSSRQVDSERPHIRVIVNEALDQAGDQGVSETFKLLQHNLEQNSLPLVEEPDESTKKPSKYSFVSCPLAPDFGGEG